MEDVDADAEAWLLTLAEQQLHPKLNLSPSLSLLWNKKFIKNKIQINQEVPKGLATKQFMPLVMIIGAH